MAASIRGVWLLPKYIRMQNLLSYRFGKSCSMIVGNCHMSSGGSHGKGKELKQKLDLAKPGKAAAAKKWNRENITMDEHSEEEKLNADLVEAAKKVAGHMPRHCNTVESDLLQKLREHVTLTETQRQGQIKKDTVGDMFKGLKVEKRPPRRRRGQVTSRDDDREVGPGRGSITNDVLAEPRSPNQPERVRTGTRQRTRSDLAHLRLYDGKALDIFSAVDIQSSPAKIETNLFDTLEREEMALATTFPAENAWEEAILWTKEGKIWSFPIDNELGMVEEAEVGFHEHVFLDHLLEPFPKKGPIRHFMELVVVGLSKNPYLTVKQKQDHVAWFKEYFKDKYHIVDALLEDKTEATKLET